MKRSQSLKRETLAALTGDELGAVAGAAAPTTPVAECLPVRTLRINECVQASDSPSCLDCATRAC